MRERNSDPCILVSYSWSKMVNDDLRYIFLWYYYCKVRIMPRELIWSVLIRNTLVITSMPSMNDLNDKKVCWHP